MPLPARHENRTASERSAPVDALTRRFASPIEGSTAGDLNAPEAVTPLWATQRLEILSSNAPRSLFGHSRSSNAVRTEPKALIERVALDESNLRPTDVF